MLEEWGCQAKVLPIAKDEPGAILSVLRKAVSTCDAVILNAGSSAGGKDFSVEAIHQVGEVVLHGVAIKPGKPAILGYAKRLDKESAIPIIGLPGYPVSGILVLEQLFKPVLEMLTCRPSEQPRYAEAVISRRLNSSLKYLEFIRARLGRVGGKLVTVPLNRGAGVVSSICSTRSVGTSRQIFQASALRLPLIPIFDKLPSVVVIKSLPLFGAVE